MRTDKSKPNYEKDFVAWAQHQAHLLKNHKVNEIDYENIAEEIEDLAKKHKRELKKRLIKLMSHLLKMKFQPEMQCRSWKATIYEQREEIKYLLEENPSMKALVKEYWNDCYKKAIEDATLDIGEYVIDFPKKCPWTFEQIMKDK